MSYAEWIERLLSLLQVHLGKEASEVLQELEPQLLWLRENAITLLPDADAAKAVAALAPLRVSSVRCVSHAFLVERSGWERAGAYLQRIGWEHAGTCLYELLEQRYLPILHARTEALTHLFEQESNGVFDTMMATHFSLFDPDSKSVEATEGGLGGSMWMGVLALIELYARCRAEKQAAACLELRAMLDVSRTMLPLGFGRGRQMIAIVP